MAEQQGAQMQNQLNQLMTQVQRLTGELQDSGQRETTLVERLNQVAQQQAQMRVESNLGPLVDAITESQKQVVAALQKDKKLTLVDNRGVAKPDKLTKVSCDGRPERKVLSCQCFPSWKKL